MADEKLKLIQLKEEEAKALIYLLDNGIDASGATIYLTASEIIKAMGDERSRNSLVGNLKSLVKYGVLEKDYIRVKKHGVLESDYVQVNSYTMLAFRLKDYGMKIAKLLKEKKYELYREECERQE